MWRAVVLVGVLACGGDKSSPPDKAPANPGKRIEVKPIDGTLGRFQLCREVLAKAIADEPDNRVAMAQFVECAGLEVLVCGTRPDEAERVAKAVGAIALDEPGGRELRTGRIALDLARLGEPGAPKVGELAKPIAELVELDPKRTWPRWLRARAQLAAGERKAARAEFDRSSLPIARVDYADLLAAEGKPDIARKIYGSAGFIDLGYALMEPTEANTKLDLQAAPRFAAYVALARASLDLTAESLAKAIGDRPPKEPRYWARVAWLRYQLGDLAGAAKARANVVWHGPKPEPYPDVRLVDAALTFASGGLEKALAVLDEATPGLAATTLRAHALLELHRGADAAKLLDKPASPEEQVLQMWARGGGPAKEVIKAIAGRDPSVAALGWYAIGRIELAAERLQEARDAFEKAAALDGPVAYRAHFAIAHLAARNGNDEWLRNELGKTLAANPGFEPAKTQLAKLP